MSIFRRTALKTVERADFDGNYFDSFTHARMFRSYKPFDMGVKSAELYSSELKSDLINKKFTYYTVAQGNCFLLPGGVDDYSWKLVSNQARTFRITASYPTPNNQAGKAGTQFKIGLDTPGLMEPVLLKTESSNLPRLRIIGQPKQIGANSWEYVVELQDGDMNSWIPVEYLQENREMIDCGTSVSDELNQKYGGDYFDDMFKLQGVVGNFARKATFTDKFIRTEIASRQGKGSINGSYTIQGAGGKSYSDGAIGVGYVYQQNFKNKGGKIINKGVFVTNIEARLEERLMNDREMSMEFGRHQVVNNRDMDTGRPRKDPAGWRQISRESHYYPHNGSLTLSELEDYITNIFATRKNFKDRTIKIATGEGGFKFLHRLIASEASQFQTLDTLFIRERSESQVHENELEFGSQFTKIKLLNGIIIELIYDPIKDDPGMFPEKAPGSFHSIESYSMDIFDFGVTDQTPQGTTSHQNITCVMQDGVEEYSRIEGLYNFETGAINDGSTTNSSSKELEIRRATTGALAIFDTSRVGRIEFVPGFVA